MSNWLDMILQSAAKRMFDCLALAAQKQQNAS
jgi:hypothetical protein